jgi:hypothetical protein
VAKTFLRSGNLDAVLALGENGQPVYASALQIRETLRLRRQSALADCLAIPQANERGDRLDWYAPFSGRVKSWLGASVMNVARRCNSSPPVSRICRISVRARARQRIHQCGCLVRC